MQHLRRSVTAALLAVPTLIVLVLLGGCADYSELQFVQDHRLTFTAPGNNELVETPFKLKWRMDDFEVLPKRSKAEPTDDAGYYAVFVDLAPVKPNHTLDDVGNDDPACESDPRCPDQEYLNAKGVYVTRKPQITLDVVAPLPTKERVQRHEVTVVLLDSEGRRIGESAWWLKFKMVNRTPVI
jgi:hypothetical protein